MRQTYQVNGICSEGFTLVSREAFTLKAAKEEAKLILSDREYVQSGLTRVDIVGDLSETIELQYFVKS
jgi:hypothetical protein